MADSYVDSYKRSIWDPNKFWSRAAQDCYWYKKWDKVLDDSNKPFFKWFAGGITNTCYNALDYHVDMGRGSQVALIYDSPVTGVIRKYTYLELCNETAKFAGVLSSHGISKGDRIVIYMPMIPETVIAMLSSARIGAIHSVVFGGFAAKELAKRIDDAKPKIVLSASCGIEVAKIIKYKPLLDEAIDIAKYKPEKCIIFQRSMEKSSMIKGRDIDWVEAVAEAVPHGCVPVSSVDPLYILYTSGTTGQPKGVVRDNGGHLVSLKWSMKNIYNIDVGDVFWAASDVGWVVGHSYIVYAPLFKGATTVLFEGKPVSTPDAGVFWRVISQHKVKVLFTAPTAFRAIKREDPDANLLMKYDLSSFESLFLAGERSDSDTIQWSEKNLRVPVIDHWWQTETGWAVASNFMGLNLFPVKYGSVTKSVPGWNLEVLDSDGNKTEKGKIGSLVAKLPLPPGALLTLWKDDSRYVESYLGEFPGYYKTSDAGYIDDDGYVFVMSRTDDIINVAGHRLSTGAMEEILSDHSDVAECAVLGVRDKLKGQIPVGLIVLNAGVKRDIIEIQREIVKMVRDRIGPVAAFKVAVVVKRLPKTRSGKILRGTIKKIADNEKFNIPATIDDPEILDEIQETLSEIGYGKKLTS